MTNLDLLNQKRVAFATQFRDALDQKDDKKLAQAFNEFSNELQQSILDIKAEFDATADRSILTARGMRQLTSVEQKFYEDIASAFKASDPKAALSGVDNTFPITVIDSVMEDVQANHPLLAALDFQNTTASTKWLYHDGSTPLATWDKLTKAIVEEMASSIGLVSFDLSKLSAFIPVPKDLLDLGAIYLDAYARAILGEAIANGYEYGSVKGSGKNQPIAMIKNLDAGVVNGEYADKTKVALNSFEPEEYCGIIANLAKRSNGTYRDVFEVGLIVNPKDYISKVIPSTTARGVDGTYKNGIFPFLTTVFTSAQLNEGDAILGVLKNGKFVHYKAFFAGALSNIDYSDEYQWLEDNRVYKTKVYAYGFPVDNTSFIYLDISALKAAALKVKVVNETDGSEGETTPTYSAVTNPTGNPSASGYYELIGENYVASEDTEVDAEKTYYTLDA